jgi:hypothetical protein
MNQDEQPIETEMRSEYDFSGGVRGKYYEAFIATEKIAALATESYLGDLVKQGSRERYETVLASVADVEPEPYDQLPNV